MKLQVLCLGPVSPKKTAVGKGHRFQVYMAFVIQRTAAFH